jgi:ubiquinone/menaquinone biosynthesis C-methylase UbiE
MTSTITQAKPAQYEDLHLDYYRDYYSDYCRDYWAHRDYEHDAEVMAVRRLLEGHSFDHAVDIGGGYGRLAPVLSEYARSVTLVDSSQQQVDIARRFLAGRPRITPRQMEASDLRLRDDSADLVTMIRVLHHLPNPAAELREMHRILRPGGHGVIEVANVAHLVNRLRYLVSRKPIPLTSVDIRPQTTRLRDGIPLVNHHPAAVAGQLQAAGLNIERMLSVSNLRHEIFRRLVPGPALLAIERVLQERLAPVYFGPSIFFLVRKPE